MWLMAITLDSVALELIKGLGNRLSVTICWIIQPFISGHPRFPPNQAQEPFLYFLNSTQLSFRWRFSGPSFIFPIHFPGLAGGAPFSFLEPFLTTNLLPLLFFSASHFYRGYKIGLYFHQSLVLQCVTIKHRSRVIKASRENVWTKYQPDSLWTVIINSGLASKWQEN